METPEQDAVEIVGLADEPVTVKDGEVVSAEERGEQDMVAEMKAAVEADRLKEERRAEGEEIPLPRPGEEAPTGDTKRLEGEEGEVAEDDSSEAERVVEEVEELGGVEVLKAVRPLIEAIYNPELTAAERAEAVVRSMPEEQSNAIRNEFFWQATAVPEVQEILVSDPEAMEVFAQKRFGLPYAVLEHIVNQEKDFLDEDEIEEIVAEAFARREAEEGERAEEERPQEAKAAQGEAPQLTPEFSVILNDLSTDVEEIVGTAALEPDPKDDAATARLKAQALKDFSERWRDAFVGDEKAARSLAEVRGLAVSGTAKLARDKYPALSKNARRVAAELLREVTEPLTAHRMKTQGKGRRAASAPGLRGRQMETRDSASGREALPDINSPEFDKLFAERAGG